MGHLIDGKYELLQVAGEGGMATVWKAVMRGAAGFTRTVAVKKMKPEFRAGQTFIAMFIEEARVGAELQHPNIVQVYDFVQDADGMYCLVTDWVDGTDLATLLRAFRERKQRTPWPMIAGIGVGALRGLGAAHERRDAEGRPAPVVHRDVSPHNVMLGTNGVVKLSDFGLARARDRAFSLTAPGTVKGKLSYLCPEIAFGQEATPLSDLFSTGTVLWEALAGKTLFDGKTDVEVFTKIRAVQIASLDHERPDLPQDLVDLVHRALAKDPAERFQSAREMAGELAGLLAAAPDGGDSQTTLGKVVQAARGWHAAQSDQHGRRTDREMPAVELSDSHIEILTQEPILLTRTTKERKKSSR